MSAVTKNTSAESKMQRVDILNHVEACQHKSIHVQRSNKLSPDDLQPRSPYLG